MRRRTPACAGVTLAPAALVVLSALTGCSSAAAADMQVGDCLKVGGTSGNPDAARASCGGPESNYKVVATVDDSDLCPTDVDSYYSTVNTFKDSSQTMCMDIDWVVGGCMSVDPEHDRDPVRADCADTSVPNRQRATEILHGVANVDQCGSGVGYAYDEREFTVCVEDVS